MVAPLSLRLGLKEAKHDVRTLRLERYLDLAKLPHPPRMVNWTNKVINWRLLLNDKIGCCGPAGAAHLKMAWTSQVSGVPCPIMDDDVLKEYQALTGYDPATGTNDTGVYLLDMLKRWVNVGMFGSKALAFVSVNLHNVELVQTAAWLFGGLLVGAALPQAAEEQTRCAQAWTVAALPFGVWSPGSWGYHCMTLEALDTSFATFITWGGIQRALLGWVQTYLTECYAVIGPEWFNGDKVAPSGFNVDQLVQDAKLLAAA
jgi:hypothetical protein